MAQKKTAHIIFPHQLFQDTLKLKADVFVFVEDDLFFKQYSFHKQKLMLHRASMREFNGTLTKKGKHVEYVESSSTSSRLALKRILKKQSISHVTMYDVADDWLAQETIKICEQLHIERETIVSPGFLTTRGQIDDYFSDSPNRMQQFYQWQRKRLDVLMDGEKPMGGKWSYDDQNRKPLPKNVSLPKPFPYKETKSINDAKKWVEKSFAKNPGTTNFAYPVTHADARAQLKNFLTYRFTQFGPYEDAIVKNESQLFHSVLSPLLNIGLITPQEVLDETLAHAAKNDIPIESIEGFVRQIIGWREYMRATYVRFGRGMRTHNKLHFRKKLDASWWDGTTGIEPIDDSIHKVLDTAYAHHIERLMILGNSMVLFRIDPDDVYEWFMSLFIDAYDWVMVPNVYAMSQFAAGELITTKPYVSGSNYIVKMSDYKKDEWADTWDGLYWQFVDDYREVFEKNYRSAMMVKMYDKFDKDKKAALKKTAKKWL